MFKRHIEFILSGGVFHMPPGRFIQSPYFASGNPETEEYTAVPALGSTLPPAGSIGQVADFDQGGAAGPVNLCRYQFVQCGAGVQPLLGSVMYWLNKGLNTVTTVRTTGGVAGICRIATAAAAEFIWILKKGDRTVLFQGAPTSAPDANNKPVVAATGFDGVADCLANAEAQGAFPLIGTAIGAAAANLALVRVNIPDQY